MHVEDVGQTSLANGHLMRCLVAAFAKRSKDSYLWNCHSKSNRGSFSSSSDAQGADDCRRK